MRVHRAVREEAGEERANAELGVGLGEHGVDRVLGRASGDLGPADLVQHRAGLLGHRRIVLLTRSVDKGRKSLLSGEGRRRHRRGPNGH